MVPRILIDTAEVPGGGELRLIRQGETFSIMLGANALMTSRQSGSERDLALLACERIAGRPRPSLLIGGLGMGFTLRAALGALGGDAELVVSELAPAILRWARGPLAPLHGASLDDPRVRIVEGDVVEAISAASGRYDAILLDVDNGPDGLSRAGNDRLYDAGGLARAKAALRPGGVLAIWSAAPDPAFARRLARAGFAVEERKVRAHSERGRPRHIVWLALRA